MRTPARWSSCPVVALLLACGTAHADDAPAESVLTVGRLFGAREFDTEPLPARRWSKRSSTYFTLETAGTGRELVRHDPATGEKEVVVPAAAFVPNGAREPLAVEGYEFSADESRVLIYTNSRRMWRRNTRGDYWLLDVPARRLRKLGGDAAPATLMFATLSPDGTRVAFVRENNLYVQDLESLKVTTLTTDGSKTLINGTSDWVKRGMRDAFEQGKNIHKPAIGYKLVPVPDDNDKPILDEAGRPVTDRVIDEATSPDILKAFTLFGDRSWSRDRITVEWSKTSRKPPVVDRRPLPPWDSPASGGFPFAAQPRGSRGSRVSTGLSSLRRSDNDGTRWRRLS